MSCLNDETAVVHSETRCIFVYKHIDWHLFAEPPTVVAAWLDPFDHV